MDNYGKNVASLRVKSGLTQKQLADKIDVPPSLISDYERGKLRLHADIIVKIAEALEISSDTILGINADSKNQEEISLRLMKRIKKIEKLSEFKRKIVLQMIDGYIRGEEENV